MKKSRYLGWQILVIALVLFKNVCSGLPRAKNETVSDETRPSTTPVNTFIPEDQDSFVPYPQDAFNAFDWDLYRQMSRTCQGNLLISPISLKLALILLYEGSMGKTAEELANTMHLSDKRSTTRDKFSSILRSLQPAFDEFKLNIGTRIFMDSQVTTTQRYVSIIKEFYRTDVVPTEFAKTIEAAKTMNDWVSNVTQSNIEGIIDEGDIMKDTVMLVLNVLYFKGSWHQNTFMPNDTNTGKFYKSANSTVDVQFMNTNGEFFYTESPELDAILLRIPYVGRKFAMYFVVPQIRGGLDDVVKKINSRTLSRTIRTMQDLPVDVKIPKFKFDFTSHLESTLREMGIRDIFEETATFNQIARAKRNSPRVVVSDVVQKTGIEVNEEGTTAYATTEIQLGNKMREQVFVADHPFLFFINDEVTETILYMGRVSNPLEQSGSTKLNSRPVQPMASAANPTTNNGNRNSNFDVELLKAINDQSEGNVVVSPLSIKAALAAIMEGTGGKTRQELISALGFPSDVSQIRNHAKYTLAPFQNGKSNSRMSLATRIWTKPNSHVSIDYNNALENYYYGDIRTINFENPVNAAVSINEWVKLQTNNKIQSIVEPANIDPQTILLLTSALHFKGRWLQSFNVNDTTVRCFQVPNVGCKNVPMMEQVSMYNYGVVSTLGATVAEIPYAGGELSMLVFLPNDKSIQGLQTMSRELTYTPISVILANLQETELLLQIPTFSIETKQDLRPVLETIGIRDLFNANANVSGILPEVEARIGGVHHNAKIRVNEVGTIAAAVTSISIIPLIGPSYVLFRVDRPFIFAIVHRPTNGILFAGRVLSPDGNKNQKSFGT